MGSAWESDNLIGRWGKPEDVNGAVVFRNKSFITGSDIKVEVGFARVGEENIVSD